MIFAHATCIFIWTLPTPSEGLIKWLHNWNRTARVILVASENKSLFCWQIEQSLRSDDFPGVSHEGSDMPHEGKLRLEPCTRLAAQRKSRETDLYDRICIPTTTGRISVGRASQQLPTGYNGSVWSISIHFSGLMPCSGPLSGQYSLLPPWAKMLPSTFPPVQSNRHSREYINLQPCCALIKDQTKAHTRCWRERWRTNLVRLCHLPHYMIMMSTVCLLSKPCKSDCDSLWLCPPVCRRWFFIICPKKVKWVKIIENNNKSE